MTTKSFGPILVTLVVCVIPNPTQGQELFPNQFQPGERLVFEGRLGPIRVGEASMNVLADDSVAGDPVRHLNLTIRANVIGVYRLRDRFDSWVSLADGVSRRFRQEYHESNQNRVNEYLIFPDSGFYRQVGIDSARTVALPLDDTAFLYWVRTLDLTPGDTLVFDRYFRSERNPVTIAVLARDTIDVPAGRFATVVVQPTIPDGGMLFSEKAQSRVWISDDERRLVVRISVKLLSRFPLSLRLREYELPGR